MITPDDKSRFTDGDCHILARALHMRTGWPICSFTSPCDDLGDVHAFVRMPDGQFLDVNGVQTEKEICKRWDCKSIQERIPWKKMRASWGGPQFGHYSYKRSGEVAEELLSSVL